MPDIVTFDPDNLRIVEISAGGDNELSIQEIYSEWKSWLLADPSRLAYPQAFRYVGADPISESQSLGSTYFLTNNWRIRPAEIAHRLKLSGNLFTDPAGFSPVVGTLGSFPVVVEYSVSNLVDAVFVNAPEALLIRYEGSIWWDPVNGSPGTVLGTNGTKSNPVNNIVDLVSLVDTSGLRDVFVFGGSLTLTAAAPDYRDWIFRGYYGVNPNGKDVNNAAFYDVAVSDASPQSGNEIVVINGRLKDIGNVRASISRTNLDGTITLNSGNGYLAGNDCFATDALDASVIIDVNGANNVLSLQRFSGNLTLRNVGAGAKVRLVMEGGNLTLESTCTGGTIDILGTVGTFIDQSAGSTVVNTAMSNALIDAQLSVSHGAGNWEGGGGLTAGAIADAVWDEASADHVTAGSMGQLESRLDAAVTTRAATGAAMTLTSGERAAIVAAIQASGGLSATQAEQLLEMYLLMGLDPAKPLVVSETTRKVPSDGTDIDQTIVDNAGVVTVTRV